MSGKSGGTAGARCDTEEKVGVKGGGERKILYVLRQRHMGDAVSDSTRSRDRPPQLQIHSGDGDSFSGEARTRCVGAAASSSFSSVEPRHLFRL